MKKLSLTKIMFTFVLVAILGAAFFGVFSLLKPNETYSYLTDSGKIMNVVMVSSVGLKVEQTIEGDTIDCNKDGINLLTKSFATDVKYNYDVVLKNAEPESVTAQGYYLRWKYLVTIDGVEYNANSYCKSNSENALLLDDYYYYVDANEKLATFDTGFSTNLLQEICFAGTYDSTTLSYGSILDKQFSGSDLKFEIVIDGSIEPFEGFSITTYEYIENDTGITIIGITTDETELVIPTEIDVKTVTAINNEAFQNASHITSLTVPGTVKRLGNLETSTGYLTNLQTLTLEEGIGTIGCNMFENASGLWCIDIPSTVTSILDYAFYDAMLEEICFAESSQPLTIGEYALGKAEYLCWLDTNREIESIEENSFADSYFYLTSSHAGCDFTAFANSGLIFIMENGVHTSYSGIYLGYLIGCTVWIPKEYGDITVKTAVENEFIPEISGKTPIAIYVMIGENENYYIYTVHELSVGT